MYTRSNADSFISKTVFLLATLVFLVAANSGAQAAELQTDSPSVSKRCVNHKATKQAFFGDLHVHTALSFDAASQDTRNRPSDAYDFAKGGAMGIQPYDEEGNAQRTIQLDRPLDFTAVTDHAEFLGEVGICATKGSDGYWHPACISSRVKPSLNMLLFGARGLVGKERWGFCGEKSENCFQSAENVWQEVVQAAEDAYDKSENCSFTSFVGYEWTASVGQGSNLHRNVIFKNAKVPKRATSWIETPSAVDLWNDLEKNCVNGIAGCDAITIPHNSNLSGGLMFQNALIEDDFDYQEPATKEQMARRARWEPIAELMQHKGSSECDSRTFWVEDEFCDFEKLPYDRFGGKTDGTFNRDGFLSKFIGGVLDVETSEALLGDPNNFVRYALKEGLKFQQEQGVNPFKYGLISATDTHIAAPGLTQEKNHPGHGGAGKGARDGIVGLPDDLENSPGGLTVIWAEENTREALFAGMQNRETYATSGTRPILRMFASWDYPENFCADPDMIAKAYQTGVPMGSDIASNPGNGAKPHILVSALMDPGTPSEPGSPLQRIQLIKGWYDDGELKEKVINVAGGANDATVDINTCQASGEGHRSLCTVWTDEEFDAEQSAFYYTRVLENPSCRWSQYICLDAKVDCDNPDSIAAEFQSCCSSDHKPIQQERAWSSPVWYNAPAS